MRATIKNYLEAMKQRREEEGEKGFSLIELIIVVVILGILVAIAIPIFVNIQATAEKNAVMAAAANGATAAAAAAAGKDEPGAPTVADAAESAGTNGIVVTLSKGSTVTDICVKAEKGANVAFAGPGALAASGTTPSAGCK
ncbi:type II secretion system protein [Microbacterium hibisci]|uniref:type II secretion system protein n=1 Tax=Microbacterium hibisci TaxID=2036000 RepID=UPI001940B367|nr:prepilin-type N-terminal cleavage/methylation domain-containing protein [Microbacterium hibisci]